MDAASSTSSDGPQPSSTSPAPEGKDTAKMNPENRLILIVIASVIGGVLLLGGLLSLYRQIRDRRRARSHLPTHIPPTRTTTQTPLIPGIAFQRLHTNMTGASTDSISTHHTRTTGTGEGGGYGEGTSTGRDTPDLIAPTPHTPQIVVMPPASDSDSPNDTSLATRMGAIQPSARSSDRTEKQLAHMRERYGAYLEKQGQRVRAGSVTIVVPAPQSLADDLGTRGGGDFQQCVDVGEGPPHEVAAETDSAAGDEKDARARWGGVSVQLAPVQVERPSKGRGLSLGKLPGYEMRQTVDTGR